MTVLDQLVGGEGGEVSGGRCRGWGRVCIGDGGGWTGSEEVGVGGGEVGRKGEEGERYKGRERVTHLLVTKPSSVLYQLWQFGWAKVEVRRTDWISEL